MKGEPSGVKSGVTPHRVIVGHPGRQHSYRLAEALKRHGLLSGYATTVYHKGTSGSVKLIEAVLGADNVQRFRGRRCEALDDAEVVLFCKSSGFAELLLGRLVPSSKLHVWWERRTSKRFQTLIAAYAIRQRLDAIVMYDANASYCFEILKKRAPNIKRILDVSAANRFYMKRVYEEDMLRNPAFAERLYSERRLLLEGRLSHLAGEIENADLFLCPSRFVMRSLVFSGVEEARMGLCPYGSNFEVLGRDYSTSSGRLKVLYVGSVTEMKGISYLIEGLRGFDESAVSLTIIGQFDNGDGLFDDVVGRFDFRGRLPHAEVQRLALESDIFICPSLGEGMSLASLEAMACGLPLVCTENSGVDDLIEEGVSGFVVPVGSAEAIRDRVDWFLNNRDRIPAMGQSAQRIAAEYTWERYSERVVAAIEGVLE